MMLYPLAEVCLGMFMPIVVSRRQFVMDVLRHRKGCNGKQEEDKPDRPSIAKN